MKYTVLALLAAFFAVALNQTDSSAAPQSNLGNGARPAVPPQIAPTAPPPDSPGPLDLSPPPDLPRGGGEAPPKIIPHLVPEPVYRHELERRNEKSFVIAALRDFRRAKIGYAMTGVLGVPLNISLRPVFSSGGASGEAKALEYIAAFSVTPTDRGVALDLRTYVKTSPVTARSSIVVPAPGQIIQVLVLASDEPFVEGANFRDITGNKKAEPARPDKPAAPAPGESGRARPAPPSVDRKLKGA